MGGGRPVHTTEKWFGKIIRYGRPEKSMRSELALDQDILGVYLLASVGAPPRYGTGILVKKGTHSKISLLPRSLVEPCSVIEMSGRTKSKGTSKETVAGREFAAYAKEASRTPRSANKS